MARLKNIQTRIPVTNKLNSTQRVLVAQRVIAKIRENTSNGIGSDGKKYPGYTESYKESLDFEIANKGSTPNLRLTGDMIADLDLLDHGPGYILIGYPKDYSDADKVEGNQIGASGKKGVVGNKDRARPFIGLPSKEVELIVAEVRANADSVSGDSLQSRVTVESILQRFGLRS